MKSMKGGVAQLNPAINTEAAFIQFITHCPSVRIMTDTSRSSITLAFGGCPPAQSPYYHTRITHGFRQTALERRVTQCLVKLVLLRPAGQELIERPFLSSNYASDREEFLLETPDSIVAEVNLQHQIYNQSLFPIEGVAGVAPPQCYFSPICPSIINYTTRIVDLLRFRDIIFARIDRHVRTPRPALGEPPATTLRRYDGQILLDFFNYATGLVARGGGMGLVTMEIMSNSMTLGDYLREPGRTDAERRFMYHLSYIQIRRLGALGIVHEDCHEDNIMVNITQRYLPAPNQLGNAFLIDFGATNRIQRTWDFATIMPHYRLIPNRVDVGYARQLMAGMHAHNRTFLDQVRTQITPTDATVDDFIARFMAHITARLGNVAPRMTGGSRTSSDNRFSNKKISFDEFIDMIINDMKPPVKFDLIEITNNSRKSPKKSPLNNSRKSPKKSPLNNSRRTQSPKSTYSSSR